MCYDDPKYFAIYRDLADAVGSDILVKYKSSPTQVISCTYSKEVGDFELNNAYAEYFLAITDHFLITDFGTAPGPRGLTVYDLDSQTKYFSDLYLYSVKSEKGEIIYWTPSKIEPSKANCSEYWDYEMGAKIAVRVSLNLETLVKKELGEFQCYPLQ